MAAKNKKSGVPASVKDSAQNAMIGMTAASIGTAAQMAIAPAVAPESDKLALPAKVSPAPSPRVMSLLIETLPVRVCSPKPRTPAWNARFRRSPFDACVMRQFRRAGAQPVNLQVMWSGTNPQPIPTGAVYAGDAVTLIARFADQAAISASVQCGAEDKRALLCADLIAANTPSNAIRSRFSGVFGKPK